MFLVRFYVVGCVITAGVMTDNGTLPRNQGEMLSLKASKSSQNVNVIILHQGSWLINTDVCSCVWVQSE